MDRTGRAQRSSLARLPPPAAPSTLAAVTRWSPRSARRIAKVVRALWFVPAIMATAGVLLGLLMPWIDAIPEVLETISFGWLRTVLDSAPAGAQQVLATSAGALATILGVAFSLTLVTLQLATAQYTPRLVGRLLEDRVTKVVLGSYIGTVAYLLLVLRAVHGVGEGQAPFVPRLSLLLALLFILGCLGLLAYFVHHLGESIQAANVGARVTEKTIRVLDRLQRNPGQPLSDDAARDRALPPEEATPLLCDGHGYVQLIDLERLVAALPRGASVVRVEVAAGDYVLPEMPLVSLWPGRALSPRESRALLDAFALGPQRTVDQDVLYGTRQLADVGLKALSPGVNDETTAITIVNHLAAVLAAACRYAPDAGAWRRHDLDGVVVIAPTVTVRRLVEDAFAGLVRFSANHPRVLARIVEVVADVAAHRPDGDGRDALLEVASWVEHAASRGELAPHERRLVGSRLAQLRAPRVRGPAERPHAMH
jgi:uncharacterized membrane protein